MKKTVLSAVSWHWCPVPHSCWRTADAVLHPVAGGLSQTSIFNFISSCYWEPSAEVTAGRIECPNYTCTIALVSNSHQANRWKTILDLSFHSGRIYVDHALPFSLHVLCCYRCDWLHYRGSVISSTTYNSWEQLIHMLQQLGILMSFNKVKGPATCVTFGNLTDICACEYTQAASW